MIQVLVPQSVCEEFGGFPSAIESATLLHNNRFAAGFLVSRPGLGEKMETQ